MFKPPSNSEEEHDRMHALLKALLCGPKEIVDETERVVQEDLAIFSRKRDQLDIDKYRKAQDLAAIVEAQRWKRLERSGRQYSSSLAENLTERRKRARERKDRKLAEENEKLLKRIVSARFKRSSGGGTNTNNRYKGVARRNRFGLATSPISSSGLKSWSGKSRRVTNNAGQSPPLRREPPPFAFGLSEDLERAANYAVRLRAASRSSSSLSSLDTITPEPLGSTSPWAQDMYKRL